MWLKNQALMNNDLQQSSSFHRNFVYQRSQDITFDVRNMQCKQFCNLFIDTIDIEPTASKSWQRNPEIVEQLVPCIQRTYKITRGNNLRQFNFRLLHRILVTDKELKYYGLANCEKCSICDKLDSIEHAFLECQPFLNFWRNLFSGLTFAQN